MRMRPYRETAGEPEVCIRAFLFQGHQLLHTDAHSREARVKQTWVIQLWIFLQDGALRTLSSALILAQDAWNL